MIGVDPCSVSFNFDFETRPARILRALVRNECLDLHWRRLVRSLFSILRCVDSFLELPVFHATLRLPNPWRVLAGIDSANEAGDPAKQTARAAQRAAFWLIKCL